MENKFEVIEYLLPTSWACALINGDESGYEDDEIELITKFCDDVVADYGHAHFSCGNLDEESGFCAYHDAWYLMPLAADCATFTLLVEIQNVKAKM